MKLPFCVFLLIASLSYGKETELCSLEPVPGPCKGSFPRWFFDISTSTCTQFIWGGCGGVVPFETEKECQNEKCPRNPCIMEPDPGPCRGSFERFFYDKKTGACKSFIWGGCRGSVPFETMAECRKARCNNACSQIPETGPCEALFMKWYFDNNSGECTKFVWGGCGGSVPFDTQAECETAQCIVLPYPSPSPIPRKKRCALEPESGPCTGSETRWFWNSKNGKCETFKYGGCFGTVPFTTKSDCESAGCGPSKCLLTPNDVKSKDSLCDAFWTSWYYNRNTMRCTKFSYSGCNSVGPFTSRKECRKSNCNVKLCALGRPKLTFECAKPGRKTWYFDGSGICKKTIGDGCEHGYVFDTRRQCSLAKCKAQRCRMTPRDVNERPSAVQCGPVPMPWYYNRAKKRCMTFKRKGCEKRIPFPSRKKCQKICM